VSIDRSLGRNINKTREPREPRVPTSHSSNLLLLCASRQLGMPIRPSAANRRQLAAAAPLLRGREVDVRTSPKREAYSRDGHSLPCFRSRLCRVSGLVFVLLLSPNPCHGRLESIRQSGCRNTLPCLCHSFSPATACAVLSRPVNRRGLILTGLDDGGTWKFGAGR